MVKALACLAIGLVWHRLNLSRMHKRITVCVKNRHPATWNTYHRMNDVCIGIGIGICALGHWHRHGIGAGIGAGICGICGIGAGIVRHWCWHLAGFGAGGIGVGVVALVLALVALVLALVAWFWCPRFWMCWLCRVLGMVWCLAVLAVWRVGCLTCSGAWRARMLDVLRMLGVLGDA